MTETREAHARPDTRQRIQSVALELFAEQGYDKTSLREIAERLDVTKAALYYHFKSKEDIVASLVEDYFGQMDDLVAWGKTLPRTPESRAQVLDRYYRIVADGSAVSSGCSSTTRPRSTAWRTPRTAAICSASGWTPWSACSPSRTRRCRARSAPRSPWPA